MANKTVMVSVRMSEPVNNILSVLSEEWGLSKGEVITRLVVAASAKTKEEAMDEYKKGFAKSLPIE